MGDCYLYGKSGGGKTARQDEFGITVLRGVERPGAVENNTVWLDTDRADTDLLISQLRPQGAEGNIWLQLQEDGTSVILPGPPQSGAAHPFCPHLQGQGLAAAGRVDVCRRQMEAVLFPVRRAAL